MAEEKSMKEEGCGCILLIGFIIANILTMLFYKAIGIAELVVVSAMGLLLTMFMNGAMLWEAIEEYSKGEPLWLSFLITLAAPLVYWSLYGLWLLITLIPWHSISWTTVGHIVAIAIIAITTASAIVYRSPEVALIAAIAVSAYLSIIIAFYV